MKLTNPYVMALGSFLLAWQISNFEPDYRSVLSAILCGVFGYLPKRNK
jgi:hypothetical protein